MSPINKFKALSTNVKAGITVIAAVATLVGAVWAVDDRYVDEYEVVQTLQQYDSRVQAQISQIERDNAVKEYDRITTRYYQLKHLLKVTPNDVELKEEFEAIKIKRYRLGVELGL